MVPDHHEPDQTHAQGRSGGQKTYRQVNHHIVHVRLRPKDLDHRLLLLQSDYKCLGCRRIGGTKAFASQIGPLLHKSIFARIRALKHLFRVALQDHFARSAIKVSQTESEK
jgi:hypothetical protein